MVTPRVTGLEKGSWRRKKRHKDDGAREAQTEGEEGEEEGSVAMAGGGDAGDDDGDAGGGCSGGTGGGAPPSRHVGHLLRGLQPAPASTYASSACAFALTGFMFFSLLKSSPYTCLLLLMPA